MCFHVKMDLEIPKGENEMKKRPKALKFRVTGEFVNAFLSRIILRSYKLLPRDVQLHRFSPNPNLYDNCHIIIMTSKKFPTVREDSEPEAGCVHYNKKTKTFTLLSETEFAKKGE